MAREYFEVMGRSFENRAEYNKALRDQQLIEKLKKNVDLKNRTALERLLKEIKGEKIRFYTILGKDFQKEIEEVLKKQQMDAFVKQELKKQERRRKWIVLICSLCAVGCLGYVGYYSWKENKTGNIYRELGQKKDSPLQESTGQASAPFYTLDGEQPEKEVLDEYKKLLNQYKNLIGWVKIDDTNINYPVMQTSDNEYYLKRDLDGNNDKNGCIFMDKDCDVLKPSTNFIIYGHHMKSGNMFGKLDKYEDVSYYEKHPYIQSDTIYEKGIYQVMYVFRSRVYREDEIVFKYYQFIDANGEQEFNSYMKEMAAMSFYDTGVTAEYGDQLLTLSTCDYQETNGRFVVVAKKIAKE